MNASQIEEQAQAWINAEFRDPQGKSIWQNRFSAENMEEAFAQGFAAGFREAARLIDLDATTAEQEKITLTPSYLKALADVFRNRA